MKNLYNSWFTFIELMVVMIILVILSNIWLYSYVWYISDSRDTERKADISKVSSALKIYKQKRWYYSLPWDNFNITYSWTILAYQWKLNNNVRISSLDNLPVDPKNKVYYSYSITSNKQEFEIWATLENSDKNVSLIEWNYKSVSKNILPTLLLAILAQSWTDVETKSGTSIPDSNRKLFVYNNQNHNLLYTFTDIFSPYSDWTSFTELLSKVESNNTYWQNSDYRNCTEISEWGKLLLPLTSTPFEYQIITDTWALTNTWCSL